MNIEAFKRRVKMRISNAAVNFFKGSWDRKGFLDKKLSIWKPVVERKRKTRRGTVKDQPLVDTGAMKASVRAIEDGDDIVIIADTDYAQYHNDGGSVDGRPPQRQFIGDSEVLNDELVEIILDELDDLFT